MHAIHDDVSRAVQERVSWQLRAGAMFGEALIRSFQQYADLNMGMLRVTLEQANLVARELASARDARQFMSLAAAQVPPGATRGFDYAYYLATIVAEAQGGAVRAFSGMPETGNEWKRLADQLSDPFGWRLTLSFLKAMAEGACRLPADVARAARLALNINTPASESGKLHIAYAGPGRGGR